MKHRERYPDNWEAIALKVKEEVQWRCQMCGLACIPSGQNVTGMNRSERARQTLTVHHINLKPEDNHRENLIALCATCHLRQHRRHSSVPVGQLSLFS